jgi:hypothetical protein
LHVWFRFAHLCRSETQNACRPRRSRSRVKEPKMLKIVISATIVSIAYTVLVGIAATSLISL